MKAIQFHRFGGPEVLECVERPDPRPAPGQVLVRVHAAGVNLSDTLIRGDRYAFTPPLPWVPGGEVAGTVEGLGAGVDGLAVGDRVAGALFASGVDGGGYAELAVVDARYAVRLPESIGFDTAVALMVQGLSALGLTRHVPVAGRRVLVNAAAGGVGSLLVQLLRRAGAAQVIGAASTAAKRTQVLALGADAAVDYTASDWVERLREQTDGQGPDVVFESVGGAVTGQSLAALAPRGVLVIYGALNIQSFALGVPELKQLIFRNQALLGYAAVPLLTPPVLAADLAALFELTARGLLTPRFGGRFPLLQAAEAQRALESRQTVGKLVLHP